ncbi:hypothetical protein HDA32_005824 [Spinactinospora alkalitolerans]|uniref:Uncharacterized protein n=1 Tax=Spinactinospora alkalitolerans TaxID=687207 RepID=A0A852U9B5_9ACTN|nr:hypothetical protein [Spinactinospora alkalitolerans]NYE50704.1 hypothetical protein [Spinactinospora alkalitolerans]
MTRGHRSSGRAERGSGDSALLAAMLPTAVLTALPEVAGLTTRERRALAERSADALTAHGDDLVYGGRDCAPTFAALARGLAAAALQPGGVTYAGHHFCVRPHRDCPHPKAGLFHARLCGVDVIGVFDT